LNYGYVRVSTEKQSINRQINNIKIFCSDAVIISEKYSGAAFDKRKEWNKLYRLVKSGDTIIFDSVSRMSRNAEEGFTAYQELYNRGVNLVFLKEPHINTETYKKALDSNIQMTGGSVDFILDGINKYLMALAKKQIQLAFQQAEKEVQDLRQRTREGMEVARLNGKQIGAVKGRRVTTKKSIEAKKVIRRHSKDFGGTLNDCDVITLSGVSRNTYYKYKREIKDDFEMKCPFDSTLMTSDGSDSSIK